MKSNEVETTLKHLESFSSFYFTNLTLPLIANIVRVEMCQENERVGMFLLEGLFLEENNPKFPSNQLQNSQKCIL